jgi:hypothetical protein
MDWRVYLHRHAHSLLPCSQRWRTTSFPRTTPSSSGCGTSSGRWVAGCGTGCHDCSTTATFSKFAQFVTALQVARCSCTRTSSLPALSLPTQLFFCTCQELESLQDKGIEGSGTGFDARPAGRLGGRGPVPIHNPDPRRLREVAVKVPACSLVKRLRRNEREYSSHAARRMRSWLSSWSAQSAATS